MADLPTGKLLSGQQSQRLRAFCTSKTYTNEDLDEYASLLTNGTLELIRADFESRIEASNISQARKELASIAYGPTKVPLFNFLLQLTLLVPPQRAKYIQFISYLALEAKVPVDTPDLSGNTTLMYSISTKPYFDLEIAEILLQAGGDINHRNRYGCVAAHDIVMVGDYSTAGKKKAVDALRFFLEKGGSIDVADGDGITAKSIALRVKQIVPEFEEFLGGAVVVPPTVKKPGLNKVGRNEPCPCGSKRKYKVCCGKN